MPFPLRPVAALAVLSWLAAACGGLVEPGDSPEPTQPGAAPQAGSGGAAGGGASAAAGNAVPNELLVQFKPGAGDGAKGRVRGRLGATTSETIHTGPMKAAGRGELEVMTLPPGLAVASAAATLAGDGDVDFAEPNWIYEHQTESNDAYFTNGSLWGMYGGETTPANAYGSGAAAAWAKGYVGSGTVYVGVIDEGICGAHPDLKPNIGANPGEIPGNGKDDDGNGYVDDVNGWNFDGKNNKLCTSNDDHATHVAGTIGAVGGNGEGVAGVVWNVKMLSAKFLGTRGGTTSNAIKAVDYFTDLKTRSGLNIVATNNSWGGGGFSQGLADAIERANVAGILFIAAAGNETRNIDATASYPAGYPNANIISVGALTSAGAVASFSNYGKERVDIFAPGAGIWSTLPKASKGTITWTYGAYNGTSMATPHVTGAAALYASLHPGAPAAAIKGAILASAVATSSLEGKCLTGGRLDVSGFEPPPPPEPAPAP